MLVNSYYGKKKNIVEDMICFQQAAITFLQAYKDKNMHMPWKHEQLMVEGDRSMLQHEARLLKYLDRMYDIVQCKSKKYKTITEEITFKELNKVV